MEIDDIIGVVKVLFVSVSVVSSTKVSAAGNVNVPVFEIDDIIGVKALFVSAFAVARPTKVSVEVVTLMSLYLKLMILLVLLKFYLLMFVYGL